MILEVELNQKIKDLEQENLALKLQQESHKQYADEIFSFIDSFPSHIWKSSINHDILYINKNLQKFTGQNSQKLYKKDLALIIHPDDLNFYKNSIDRAIEKTQDFSIDYRIKNSQGKYTWVRNIASPYFTENKLAGFIGVCNDITEDKITERKLTSLLATKDRFFSVIAHDLRNPFNSILGFSELLRDTDQTFDAQKIKSIGSHLHSSAKKTLNLLENLLEWGRLQSNHISFDPISIILKNVCTEVLDNIVPIGSTKTCSIYSDIDATHTVFSDQYMLQTVFRNLITNALKYTSKGGILKISSLQIANKIQVTIEDNGIGIENYRIHKLFDVHQRFSSPGTEGEKGSGLGLVLCKEYIEKNGGEIWVESELGKGSKFIFTLPVLEK